MMERFKINFSKFRASHKSVLRAIILVAALSLICLSAVEIAFSWKTDRYVSHASAVYITLANDLVDGTFYPPYFGENGYRGTRYLPLYFSSHAGLIKLLGDPLKAGYLLGSIAGVLLLVGIYKFIRKIGGNFYLAFGFMASVFGCALTPILMTSIRGDILPAALNICGLALFVGSCELSKKRLVTIALIFSLVFAAKITSIFGVTAVCVVLLFQRKIKESIMLALMTLLGFSLVIGISQFLSEGRFIEGVWGVAAAGSSLEGWLKIPTRIRDIMLYLDGVTCLFLGLGVATFVVLPKQQRTHVSTVYFLLVVFVTTISFSNPGLHINHFLEPLAASVLLIASMLVIRKDRFEVFALGAIASVLIIAVGIAFTSPRRGRGQEQQKRYAAAIENLKEVKGPILSDNSYIPTLMGQKPFMLDAFVFRMIREKKPSSSSFAAPLFDRLERRWFAAIVLEKWAASMPGLHFGKGFYETVERNYCLAKETKHWLFYFRCDEKKSISDSMEISQISGKVLPNE